MNRCGNFTGMLHSTPGPTLIWVAVRSQRLYATSSVRESEGRLCMTAPSFLQTTRAFGKYKHPQQLLRYRMRSHIKGCCLLRVTRRDAATPLRMDVLPSRLIL